MHKEWWPVNSLVEWQSAPLILMNAPPKTGFIRLNNTLAHHLTILNPYQVRFHNRKCPLKCAAISFPFRSLDSNNGPPYNTPLTPSPSFRRTAAPLCLLLHSIPLLIPLRRHTNPRSRTSQIKRWQSSLQQPCSCLCPLQSQKG